MIPKEPETLLTRRQTADALTEAGYPTSADTLATKATRGGGPPFQKFGPRALYTWGLALGWARARLQNPVHSRSEVASQKVDAWGRQGERKVSEASTTLRPISEGTAGRDVEASVPVGGRDV
jgi:hypothetical protein